MRLLANGSPYRGAKDRSGDLLAARVRIWFPGSTGTRMSTWLSSSGVWVHFAAPISEPAVRNRFDVPNHCFRCGDGRSRILMSDIYSSMHDVVASIQMPLVLGPCLSFFDRVATEDLPEPLGRLVVEVVLPHPTQDVAAELPNRLSLEALSDL